MKKTVAILMTLALIAIGIVLSIDVRGKQNPWKHSGATTDTSTSNPIYMAIFPRRVPQVTRRAFQPLADHLQNILGQPVHLVTPSSHDEFWLGVKQGKYDLMHLNQYHYIESHELFQYDALVANEEGGSRTISGAILVKKDSNMRELSDLRGKTIIFGGGRKAMVSYITTTALLKRAGLQTSDYHTEFARNPPFAIVDTFMNKGDAAAAGAHLLNTASVKKRLGTKGIAQMHILAVSDPITHLPWAVRGDMPEDRKHRIREAMTSLNETSEGRSILAAAMVTGFFPVSDADYDSSRELVEYVTGRKY